MIRRLILLSVIFGLALTGLTWLGFYAISMHEQGLEGRRIGEFSSVAEQIRKDVKYKLDQFIQAEQNRSYTDYQYEYVPENFALNSTMSQINLRSPLADKFQNGLAKGYFQLESDGSIVTPYFNGTIMEGDVLPMMNQEWATHISMIRHELVPVFKTEESMVASNAHDAHTVASIIEQKKESTPPTVSYNPAAASKNSRSQSVLGSKSKSFNIGSLSSNSNETQTQVVEQSRDVVASNTANLMEQREYGRGGRGLTRQNTPQAQLRQDSSSGGGRSSQRMVRPQSYQSQAPSESPIQIEDLQDRNIVQEKQSPQIASIIPNKPSTVKIRLEPFSPVFIKNDLNSIFNGDVFLLRHVQIEDRHFVQGFMLDSHQLLEEIKASSNRFIPDGMGFDINDGSLNRAAFSAVLDFGFGEIVLNLLELDPYRIGQEVGRLKLWYFSTVILVFLVIGISLWGIWRFAYAEMKLASDKDDFISAVSHELRTPLTSIRMYTEMLKKGWVKSDDKRNEYYDTMNQESERLTRLIENVLDFSRLQKGRKQFNFKMGDINQCVKQAIDSIEPYAKQAGFELTFSNNTIPQTQFDHDAIMQIVINLVDNAIKYARQSDNREVIVRTCSESQYIVIEVEDHGPGFPRQLRKKVFDDFYRCENEMTRESNGVGLGLALVKNFVTAHKGLVEILDAKPNGAILKINLPVQA